MSKSDKERGVYRKNWDMPHALEDDYKRSKIKKEVKEIIEELEEDEDLKPFWEEEFSEEQKE